MVVRVLLKELMRSRISRPSEPFMNPWLPTVAFVALLIPAAACNLYFEDSGKDDAGVVGCGGTSTGQLLRDPSTGQCESFSSPDDDGCGEYPQPVATVPNWPSCISACEGLDAQTCSTTAGCHSYIVGPYCPPGAACASTEPDVFLACGAIGQPISSTTGSACTTLDASACAGSDGCRTYLLPVASDDGASPYEFASCEPETRPATCWVDSDCGATGYQCLNEIWQTPKQNACDNEFCDVPGTCIPIANGPGSCDGEVTCQLFKPACPANTVPGVADGCYTDYCIPSNQCGADDPGDCYDAVMSNQPGPTCPSTTTPGILDGQYTGFCIPLSQCQAAPSCASLATQAACEARSDCEPVFDYPPCACEMSGMCNGCTPTYVDCQQSLLATPS